MSKTKLGRYVYRGPKVPAAQEVAERLPAAARWSGGASAGWKPPKAKPPKAAPVKPQATARLSRAAKLGLALLGRGYSPEYVRWLVGERVKALAREIEARVVLPPGVALERAKRWWNAAR